MLGRGVHLRADWYADMRGPILVDLSYSKPHCLIRFAHPSGYPPVV